MLSHCPQILSKMQNAAQQSACSARPNTNMLFLLNIILALVLLVHIVLYDLTRYHVLLKRPY